MRPSRAEILADRGAGGPQPQRAGPHDAGQTGVHSHRDRAAPASTIALAIEYTTGGTRKIIGARTMSTGSIATLKPTIVRAPNVASDRHALPSRALRAAAMYRPPASSCTCAIHTSSSTRFALGTP